MERNSKLTIIGSIFLLISLVILTIIITYQSAKTKKIKSRAADSLILTPFVTLAPPQDLPVYPNAELISASSLNNNSQQTFVWQTTDEPTAVFTTIKNALFTQGWESEGLDAANAEETLTIKVQKTFRILTISVDFEVDIGRTTITATMTTNE